MLHYFSPIVEGALLEKNTQSTTRSFVEQHNSTPSEIIVDFTQIEPNIIIVDNAHTIESIALGIKDILKLDDHEVMAMATNKQRKHSHLLQKVLLLIAQEDPNMICLLGRHKYIDIIKSASTRWLEG
jgi:hypothetical protein